MSSISIKEKIRLILNLANDDAATDGEIDNAMRFAAKLMAEHNISEDDLNKCENVHDRAAMYDRMESDQCFSQTQRISVWECALAAFVCNFIGGVKHYLQTGTVMVKQSNGLAMFDDNGNVKMARAFVFYGVSEDVKLATDIYNEIAIMIASVARMRYGSVLRSSGGDYARGFVAGLSNRLTNQQNLLMQSSESRALVVQAGQLIELKKELADDWLGREKGIKLRKGQKRLRPKHFDAGAFNTGKVDSQKAVLSKDRPKKLGYSG